MSGRTCGRLKEMGLGAANNQKEHIRAYGQLASLPATHQALLIIDCSVL